jgi:ATP-dependent Clp protease ATP-binding subunit ClpA
LHRASKANRQVDPVDLFAALLEDAHGLPVAILRRYGIDPSDVALRLVTHARDLETRQEQLLKRFELPQYLKQLATNLNLQARLDKVPPVFGRDRKIQQVLEILSHRERANAVMLLGEAGVGKTAIVEGLARRLEYEPQTVPLRLRDCQIVSLQMNTLVAGTMLRGMFEERLQNVVSELKERPKAVAEALFGDQKKMVRVDMSEYQDPTAVDKLIGMPRGIVGSQRGGVLTNQLRDTPYTVVLLDEIEKANPSVLNLFLQAFDEGWLTDGRGRRVYLSDAIIIMTSNAGSEHFRKLRNPLGFLSTEVAVEQVRQISAARRNDVSRRSS